jgi:hypothetical protein
MCKLCPEEEEKKRMDEGKQIQKEYEPHPSCFKIDKSVEFEKGYIFNEISINEDVSMGQRGFYRNLDGLLALIL